MRPAAERTAHAADTNFETMYQWRRFKTDFEAFWEQMSAIMGPMTQSALKVAGFMTRHLSDQAENYSWLNDVIAGISKGQGLSKAMRAADYNFAQLGASQANKRIIPEIRETHFSALERMGLVIGGGGYTQIMMKNTNALIALTRAIVSNNPQNFTHEAHATRGASFNVGPQWAQPAALNLP
jgi:hypothetical protein